MNDRHPSGNPKVEAALGAMAMTGCHGEVSRKDAIETAHAFLAAGYRCIDTADLYADGDNEELIGEAIKGRRDQVMLVSKFGFLFGKTSDAKGLDARPERVEKCCDASLKRLGVDHLDLFYLHRVDPNVPVAETVGAIRENLAALKIRLTDAQLRELESALPASVWAGDRYPASAMKRLDADAN